MTIRKLRSRLAPIALAAFIPLAACGGGGSSPASSTSPSVVPTTPGTPIVVTPGTPVTVPTAKATSLTSFKFLIPRASVKAFTHAASVKRKPRYISADSATLNLYLDQASGSNVGSTFAGIPAVIPISLPLSAITASPTGAATTPVNVPIPGSNGENLSWNSTGYQVNGSAYYEIDVAISLIPGLHAFGVVLEDVNGFDLSETQTAPFMLANGQNPSQSLFLEGVADETQLCDTSDFNAGTCPNSTGPATNGIYSFYAFDNDSQNDTIMNQTVTGASLPLSNGPFTIQETDSQGILNIVGDVGASDVPGTATNFVDTPVAGVTITPASWSGGHAFTMQCIGVGTTSIGMYVSPTAPTHGVVNGFTYVDGTNWTTPGTYLGGPTSSISVTCSANAELIFQ